MTELDILKLIADEDFHLCSASGTLELIKLSTTEIIWSASSFQPRTSQESVDFFIEKWHDEFHSLIKENGVKTKKASDLYRDLRCIIMKRVTIA